MKRAGAKLDLDFRVKAVRGGVVQEPVFRELLGRRTIVSVHMKNNTPSCDRQTESLAAHAAEFDAAGYDLLVVSRDSAGSQARRAEKLGAAFAWVSDPEDRFAKAAGTLVKKQMYGREFTGPARAAFVLAEDGTVLAVVEKVDTADHAAQLRAVIKSL